MAEESVKNFIEHIIDDDLASGRVKATVITRFPPEPNGFLHIGHAKSICLNFGLAQQYGGRCHLRFDDTNPLKENPEYVEAIQRDVKWLGFDWNEHLYFASDYFEKFYQCALLLIKAGKAYVCHLTPDEMREYRGTLTEPGRESPYRNRSVEENLKLFEQMKDGAFDDGHCVLRAKIDLTSGNINMRDPILYRIRKAHHFRQGNQWVIYPMYDFAHSISDAIENITHSICTLEFQDHRPLYDWFVQATLPEPHPHQYEFSRLRINFTVTSKRKLLQLVTGNHVNGWDDPRMLTISGLRRRGYTPASIHALCKRVGITKKDSITDMSILEECLRDDLNRNAKRAFCVIDPLKIVIENYPEGKVEDLTAPIHPQDESFGQRTMPFTREIYIEQDDFMEEAPKKYFRLKPGGEVRLRYGYIVKCEKVIKDSQGKVIELRCTYDADTLGKKPEGRNVKGVIHWVSAVNPCQVEVRLYDRLFKSEDPNATEKTGGSFLDSLNPESLKAIPGAIIEPYIKSAKAYESFQFERLGYFSVDPDSTSGQLLFNRAVTLRDTWSGSSSED